MPYDAPLSDHVKNVNLPIRRLFVLGAGFSAHAGLPLGNGLLELVRQNIRSSFRDAELFCRIS